MDGAVGHVLSANARLRFAVLDYTLNQMPALGTTVTVYRAEARIGALKITGPARGSTIAADFVEGTPQAGDEVRPE
jgi:hypothetical protein